MPGAAPAKPPMPGAMPPPGGAPPAPCTCPGCPAAEPAGADAPMPTPGAMPPPPGGAPPAPIAEKGILGGAGGAALGGMAGGPLGAIAGGAAGSMGEDAIKPGGVLNDKSLDMQKEMNTMSDTELAKSVAELADLMKAMAPALVTLNKKVDALDSRISKELPIKDGAKYAKDEEHNATTKEQETQVHEAAPEAAVKTFKPENTKEGAFAPDIKLKAAPKTVNVADLVKREVAAMFAKQAPALSSTPTPPAAPAAGAAKTEKPFIMLIKSVVSEDRRLHGVFSKNPDAIETGFRPGDDKVKQTSGAFIRKAIANAESGVF